MQLYRTLFLATCCLLGLLSCSEDAGQATKTTTLLDQNAATDTMAVSPSGGMNTNEVIVVWTDRANLRAAPKSTAQSIFTVREGQQLTKTGQQSEDSMTVVIRGVVYREPWFKVAIKDTDKQGWVFGGEVKSPGRIKGNPAMTATVFEFPNFGRFDLNEWEKVSEDGQAAGDAELKEIIYQKGKLQLITTAVEMGEYGYSRTYDLTDRKGNPQKMRSFTFEVGPNQLVERVEDYTVSPPVVYERVQKVQAHFFGLNEKPIMAAGGWNTREIENLPTGPAEITAFSYGDCPALAVDDSGCSCTFYEKNDGEKKLILAADNENSACIGISGTVQSISGGVNDLRSYLASEVFSDEVWVTMNANGEHKILGYNWRSDYDENVLRLVQGLLMLDELPEEISHVYVGEVGTEIRAQGSQLMEDALRLAKEPDARKKYGMPMSMMFYNEFYRIDLEATVTGRNDGGGELYDGMLELRDANGKVLDSAPIVGDCGC